MKCISVNKVLAETKAKLEAGAPPIAINTSVKKKIVAKAPIIKDPTPEPEPAQEIKEAKAPTDQEALIDQLNSELKELKTRRNQLSSSIYQAIYNKTTPNSIEISEALASINNTYDEVHMKQRTFGIRALSAKGTTELLNCRKKVIDKNREKTGGTFKHNLQQHGNIMLIREDNQHRTVKVCAIYEFLDHNANQWKRVRH